MSVADLHDLELVWPSVSPMDVIVTGTFDQWLASVHLVKGDTGFSGTVKAPWGEKIAYKFIVDGRWRCRDDRPQEDDGHGNTNNVLRTPEKPLPPARLSIPAESDGDLEGMVTAVEFLPPAEPAPIREFLPLPLPIPQITVEDLGQALSDGTPVSESKLNTAVATEGHAYPATKPAFDVSTLPTNDGPVLLPTITGNGEAHEPHDASVHTPSQVATGESASSPSAVPPPSSPAAQDAPALGDRVDVAPAQQPQAESSARQQATLPAFAGEASSAFTPASSTVTQKKRRSFFARIKHIFEKDKDKRGKKEKNKH